MPTKTSMQNSYKYGFSVAMPYVYTAPKGLSKKTVEKISRIKNEPAWMLNFRKKALNTFFAKKMPAWGGDLSNIDFKNITYYARPQDHVKNRWEDVPEKIKFTFEKLGIPESERKFLAGSGAQFDSDAVYHNLQKMLQKKGVIFTDMDTAVQKYPALVRKYFAQLVPIHDNKFAALNSAVWSGGSFVYVPKNVHVALPLQAYFRINTANMGQFERTLIIAEEGSSVHYIEGCSAPVYTTDSLHAAVVEVFAHKHACVQYTTLQNWSTNVYNLVTKRAKAFADATVLWLDVNMGSKLTMKYPTIHLAEPGARGEIFSVAFAGDNQHQDTGAKMIHEAPNTTSTIQSKSISKGTGRTSYRGLVRVAHGAKNVKSRTVCDALLLSEKTRSDTYPLMDIHEDDVAVTHEATVNRISEEQLFYLRSRGLTEQEAGTLIINGFIQPIVKKLPLEYAVEMNRLIELEMTNAIG